MRRERDHDRVIGYDDVNQLFWYPEGIARIVLTDKVCQPYMTRINVLISLCQTRLVDIPPAQRFMRFDRIDWNRAFFKTYYSETVVQTSARQLQPNFGHPHLIVLVLHRIQSPHHIPAEARPFIRFDVVRNRAWGRGCNHYHGSCNARRVFVHPYNPSATFPPCHSCSYGRSYVLHRHRGESSRRRWIPCSHSRYCPVFHLYRCDPDHALRPDVQRTGSE